MRIVLIEDNQILARAVEQALRQQGHAVDWLADGADGARFLAAEGADLAIIDINLPGMSGLDVVRQLVASGGQIPVMLLTARDDPDDRVLGLDAGADDYLTKPFDMAELCARVRALGRRRGMRSQTIEAVGELTYDRLGQRLVGPDGTLALTRRETALWETLLDNTARVLSKSALCDSIYGTGADIDVNAIELLVSRLRRKVDRYGVTIRTVRGLGYMLQIDRTP